ncbi:MAG: hypothetical protein ACTJGI_05780 [Corynebacterium casei]|uniref:hypothetical protein n=1 Tax=Corynebacterium casei TaxID=160386 RepID=UPI003F920828
MIPVPSIVAQQTNPNPPGLGENHGEDSTPQLKDDKRNLPEHHEAAPKPPAKGDEDGQGKDANGPLAGKPESVQLLIKIMGGAVILEFIHQIFSFILAIVNFDVLRATAKRTIGEDSQLSDTLINLTAWGSLALTTLISLTIIGLLAVMLRLLYKKSKHAGTARRMLFVFSLYFTFRLFLVFMTRPATGTNSPDWLYVVDGSLQILVGVAAVLVLVFSSREETLEYTGEMEKLRQFEQEQKKLQEQRAREAKEKLENGETGKGAKGSKRGKNVQDEADYGTFKGMLGRWTKGGKNDKKNSKNDAGKNDKDKDAK